jgi:hypothetical protein
VKQQSLRNSLKLIQHGLEKVEETALMLAALNGQVEASLHFVL